MSREALVWRWPRTVFWCGVVFLFFAWVENDPWGAAIGLLLMTPRLLQWLLWRREEGPMETPETRLEGYYLGTLVKLEGKPESGWVWAEWPDGRKFKHWAEQITTEPWNRTPVRVA